jgi:beta-glucosidase
MIHAIRWLYLASLSLSTQTNDRYTRYDLTYADFRDQKRTVKGSSLWYGRVAASNRLVV